MTAAFYAVQRYQDAGLATPPQANVLNDVMRSDDAAAVLDQAVRTRAPLSLDEVEASADPRYPLDDRQRYIIAFGQLDPRINDFAMPGDKVAETITRAVARGTPITDEEIADLGRDVSTDPAIVY